MAVFCSGFVVPRRVNYVDYIESNGTQWINTNFVPSSQNMKVECDFICTSFATDRSLFGSQYSRDKFSIIPYAYDASHIGFYVGTTTNICQMAMSANTRYSLSAETKDGTLYVDLNGNSTSVAYSGNLVTEMPFAIFGNNNQYTGGISQLSYMRLYSFKIYDNGVLVHSYLPCLDISGVACLYDEVNKEYVYNAGTGEFTAG